MPLMGVIELEIEPLPATRLRALQLLGEPDLDLAELIAVVETDPSLTMSMLRLANSAASAPGRRIGTARAAVIRIGAQMAKRAVAGSVVNTAFRVVDARILDLDEYWRHSLATALLADAIAIRQGMRTEAFTAGLLHDIGCLAMAMAEPERYGRVTQLIRQGIPEADAERIMFGDDHAVYGHRIAERWGLAPAIADAIGDHHRGVVNDVSAMVARARTISHRAGFGDGRIGPSAQRFEAADRILLHSMRGVEGLTAQINSFQTAMGLRSRVSGSSFEDDAALLA